MADPQVLQYVQNSLAQGVSVQDIRNALLEQGWSAEEVEEALALSGQDLGFQSAYEPQPNMSFGVTIAGIIRASDTHYSELYLYKIILQVCVFGAASFVLIFIGLPWFVSLIGVMVLLPVAYMQIGNAKKKSGLMQ